MNYYEEIKNKIIDNEIYSKVKDYSKERNAVNTYYEVGKLISEVGKRYGEGIIENYSKKLLFDARKNTMLGRLEECDNYIYFSKI